MVILGIAGALTHDPSAAIVIDGKVIAAAEEERFTRKKHSINDLPINAVHFCMKEANIKSDDIDIVVFPWSCQIYNALKWKVVRRIWRTRPSRAYMAIVQAQKKNNNALNKLYNTLKQCGINQKKVDIHYVEHHLAHASSAYHLSGFKNSAILTLDGLGECTTSLFAEGREGKIKKIYEIVYSDSLGRFYSTITAYLGFTVLDGEYKVMGMAPYGDPSKINISHIIKEQGLSFRANDDYVWPIRSKRYNPDLLIPKKMIEDWGLPRKGDDLSEPYIHIAAAAQRKFEEIVSYLVDKHLMKIIESSGSLCFAGGCALNVALNRILLKKPYIKNLWVQPASHDAGTSLGAATYIANEFGEKIEPMKHVYLGPEFSNQEIEQVIKKSNFPFKYESNICQVTADLLSKGEIVGWFQGRMEWGPRALGNRSILGNPFLKGTADKINALIKFREKWRPFCPSILGERSSEILHSNHPAAFMTTAFKVNLSWRDRIPEVIHVDGTCRPQIVEKGMNPKFYCVIENFYHKTGVPVVINTSLNRRGEPMICTPDDALAMFKESGLQYLVIGDFLLWKN